MKPHQKKYGPIRIASVEHRYGDNESGLCDSEAKDYFNDILKREGDPVPFKSSTTPESVIYSFRSPGPKPDTEIRFVVVRGMTGTEIISYNTINKVLGNDKDDLKAAIGPTELGEDSNIVQDVTTDSVPVNSVTPYRAILEKKRFSPLAGERTGYITNPPYPP